MFGIWHGYIIYEISCYFAHPSHRRTQYSTALTHTGTGTVSVVCGPPCLCMQQNIFLQYLHAHKTYTLKQYAPMFSVHG